MVSRSNEDIAVRLDIHEEKINTLTTDVAVIKKSVTNHIPTALAQLGRDVSAVRNWIILTLLGVIGGLFVLLAKGH